MVMLAINLTLALVVLPITLINIVALRLVASYRATAAQRLMKDRSALMGATVGIVRSIETIKAGGLEQGLLRPLGRLPRQDHGDQPRPRPRRRSLERGPAAVDRPRHRRFARESVACR
jgi:hypothetical protein